MMNYSGKSFSEMVSYKNPDKLPTQFNLSEKSWDLLATNNRIDVLEGTARSSKTVSGLIKFGIRVNMSNHTQHFIAAADAVVARRNLVDSKLGLLDSFSGFIEEGKDTKKGNHLIFRDSKGREKYIYILGYKDSARWKQVLGSTMGCGFIDEINTANQDFINEVLRSFASNMDDYYLCATLNPSDPNDAIYKTFINKSRPLKKWSPFVPTSIIKELRKSKELIKGAIYWHYNFYDNPIMTDDKIEQWKSFYSHGSFFWQTKILGLRWIAEGSVFAEYLNDNYIATPKMFIAKDRYGREVTALVKYAIGIDIGSNTSGASKSVVTMTGFTQRYKDVIFMNAIECKSTRSDALVNEWVSIIKSYYDLYDRKIEGIFVDGYGVSQLIMNELYDKLKLNGIFLYVDKAEKFGEDAGRKERVHLMHLLIGQKRVWFYDREIMNRFKQLRYDPKQAGYVEDKNQVENDYWDSACYTITHRVLEIKAGGNYGTA